MKLIVHLIPRQPGAEAVTRSALSERKNLFIAALSQQFPGREWLGTIRCLRSKAW